MHRPPRAEPAPARARASIHITPAVLHRLPLPPVDGEQGKEGRGCVLVVGGSDQIPGAVILAATAALRAGAGKLQIATGRRVAPWVAAAVPPTRCAPRSGGSTSTRAPATPWRGGSVTTAIWPASCCPRSRRCSTVCRREG